MVEGLCAGVSFTCPGLLSPSAAPVICDTALSLEPSLPMLGILVGFMLIIYHISRCLLYVLRFGFTRNHHALNV